MVSEQDMQKSLATLIKFNNGVFKTAKQRDFLVKSIVESFNPKFAGIERLEGMKYFHFSSFVSWAEGFRANRPYGWVYEVDSFGVKRQWKLGWNDPANDGRSYCLDEKKTKLVWERPVDCDTSHLVVEEKAEEYKPISEWVGAPKDKIRKDVEVVFCTWTAGYYPSFVINMKDDNGNVYVWFSSKGFDLSKGQKISIFGTVKAHDAYKDVKQTILTRCSISDPV